MNSKVIGLIGPAGCGKSTLAHGLSKVGFVRMPLAEPLKLMLEALLTYQGATHDECHAMLYGDRKEYPTEYLGGRTPRHAMQTLGTEWRDLVSRTLWTDVWITRFYITSPECVVIEDVRFQHEVDLIRNIDGRIVEVRREGFRASDAHASEREFTKIEADVWILNTEGDPEQMARDVIYIFHSWLNSK